MVKNMKKMIRRCPICNNEYGEVYKTIKMKLPQDVKLPDEYDVVTCENCGFAYADVDATQDTYNTYYACNNMYSADAALKEKIFQSAIVLCNAEAISNDVSVGIWRSGSKG